MDLAIKNIPLVYIAVRSAKAILAHFKINSDVIVSEVIEAMELIYKHSNENTDIIFGCTYDTFSSNNDVKVMILLTGISQQPPAPVSG